jgi:CIC family chloride channel protein
MRPFPHPLPVGNGADRSRPSRSTDGSGPVPGQVPLPGPVTFQGDPQAVYAGESLTQTLRQLDAYGRDGLPVLSGDGRQAQGWITNDSVLQAIAREIGTSPPRAARPRPGRPRTPRPVPQDSPPEPPTPLPGYQVVEITLGRHSPAAGKALGTISWPDDCVPVSVLHHRSLHEPDPGRILAAGDRISLLAPHAGGALSRPQGSQRRADPQAESPAARSPAPIQSEQH